MAQVILKAGHVQPVWAGHPWVFAQGIERVRGALDNGGEVQVRDVRGNVLGRGLYSQHSAIAVRLFTRDAEQRFDVDLVEERLRAALKRRAQFDIPGPDTGYRAFYSEGDGLPGLIIDVYGTTVVLQLGTIGMHRRRDTVLAAVQKVLAPHTILDRTPAKAGAAERFEPKSGLVAGDPVEHLHFTERGFQFELPLELAQKTGYYFDQRPLRSRIEALAAGRRVLDTYSFVGSIGLSAARGGASQVLCVDSSASAHEVGRQLATLNGLELGWQRSDAVEFLDSQDPKWDLVISDPPKLASHRTERNKARNALRRVARSSVRATRPGGLLSFSSCSAALGMQELERALALGARDIGRDVWVVERVFQGPDHPVPPAFPEGLYLSTLIAEVE